MRKKLIVMASLILILGLTACGNDSGEKTVAELGGSADSYANGTTKEIKDIMAGHAVEGAGFNKSKNDSLIDGDIQVKEQNEEAAAENADVESEQNSGDNNTKIKNQSDTTINEDKLIYSSNVSIDTIEFEQSLESLRELIDRYDGFVEAENKSDNGGDNYYIDEYNNPREVQKKYKHYRYEGTIRVPSKNYEAFMTETGNLGDIRNENSNVQNISQEYYDAKAQLEILETKYKRYLEMMKKATTTEEILKIEQYVTDIEVQINQMKTRINRYDNDVAYSYIHLSIQEVKQYEEVEEEPVSFLDEINQSARDMWNGIINFFKRIILIIVQFFPIVVLFIIVAIATTLKFKKKIKENKNSVKVTEDKDNNDETEETEETETNENN